jgi:hypothetical protein
MVKVMGRATSNKISIGEGRGDTKQCFGRPKIISSTTTGSDNEIIFHAEEEEEKGETMLLHNYVVCTFCNYRFTLFKFG